MPLEFANPWGLLGLLSLPAIVVIHLYQRRFPVLYVAGVHLWSTQTLVQMPGRKRDRLPVTRSLLLELLAALLLSFVLAQPRWGVYDRLRHFVVVLDGSASMGARTESGESVRDAAMAALAERAAAAGRRARMTLVLSGRRPEILGGRSLTWPEAQQALESWQPRAAHHLLLPSVDLARQLAEEGGELLLVTDHLPDAPDAIDLGLVPDNVEIVAVGRRLENVGLTTARWTFDSESGRGEVYLRVKNFGRQSAAAALRAEGRGVLVFERRVELDVGEEQALTAAVPGGLGRLTITATAPGDALEIDSKIELVEPKPRTVHFANVLSQEGVRRILDRTMGLLPDVSSVPEDRAELILGDAGVLPPSEARLWWLGVGPVDPAEGAREAARDLLGPYLLEKRHPLLEGITFGGVIWGGVQPLTLSVVPFVSAGEFVLIGQLRGTRTTAFLLNVDLQRSNVTESPDWPILLSNLVEMRRAVLPGLRRWNYRVGESVTFRLFEGDAPEENPPLTLAGPEESKELTPLETVSTLPLDVPGVYEIRQGEKPWGEFAVQFFDPVESNLQSRAAGRRPAATTVEPGTLVADRFYTWMMLAGMVLLLAALLADWAVLRPRTASIQR